MRYFLAIFITCLLLSCSTTTEISLPKKCGSYPENKFENISIEKFKSIVNKDTLFYNELKFNCVNNASYLNKGMYDRFGKWHEMISGSNTLNPILLWKRIQLFENDTTKFTVATRGFEGLGSIYASVLVFDENDNDLLSTNSKYKPKLIEYFSNMIFNNDKKKKEFYELYWKTVSPEHWKRMESNKRISNRLGIETEY